MLGEDVEDHGGAVHDLDAHHVLQGAALGGGELAVDNDRVRPDGRDHLGELLGLARAQVGGGVGVVAPLGEGVQDLAAGGGGQGGQLTQGGLGVGGALGRGARLRGCGGQVQSHQDHPLQADLAVLDLADVLQLGAQGGGAAGRGASLALQGAGVVGLVGLVVGGGGGQGGGGA